MTARRKYFDSFYKADPNQMKKLEGKFFASIENLRKFEEELPDDQKEELKTRVDRYPSETGYADNHELTYEGDQAPEGPFEDPHATLHQLEKGDRYANDTEESVGTMEDYLKLKENQ